MSEDDVPPADLELSCEDLGEALDVFGHAGFRVETIFPADDPSTAVIQGQGVRLRLRRARRAVSEPPAPAPAPFVPSFVVTKNDPTRWRPGRAGMLYRDLVPDRQGGRFIASHIRIEAGGPVPDYVHYHAIRFQMIYCYRGWVRLVYEDQGEPFVMHAGDCVLQPPKIRHRVLECSPGLEVVEIGTPAVHPTFADHDMALPTPHVRAERDFGGQRFIWHRGGGGSGSVADFGLGAASAGVGEARLVREARASSSSGHDRELFFGFVLDGAMTVRCDGRKESLAAGDAFVLPPGQPYDLDAGSPDLGWLEVTLPARPWEG